MLPVSQAFMTAINSHGRNIKHRVEIFLYGDDATPLEVTESNYIVNSGLLEEAFADTDKPIGAVSANEFIVTLNNQTNYFTPTNISSPYYGLLTPGVLVKPFLSIKVANGSYEEVPLGIFRTAEWKAPNTSVETTVVCYDVLYEIGNLDMPKLSTFTNVTIVDLFTVIFEALGLSSSEYNINSGLTKTIKYAWFTQTKVKEALQELAAFGLCYVFCDRNGIIQVQPIVATASDTVITHNDIVIECSVTKSQNKIFAIAQLNYVNPTIGTEIVTLGKIDKISVGANDNATLYINFTNAPTVQVKQIKVKSKSTDISSMELGAVQAVVELTNTGVDDEEVSIEIIGIAVSLTNSNLKKENAVQVAKIGKKATSLSSMFVQDKATADSYATDYLSFMSYDYVDVTILNRGNPAIEVLDSLTVDSPQDGINYTKIIVQRHELTFDGGLESKIIGKRVMNWILSSGIWDDSLLWIDTEYWNDGV